MARALRRIVTGHNASGRSVVVVDGRPPAESPDPAVGDIWATDVIPADNGNVERSRAPPEAD